MDTLRHELVQVRANAESQLYASTKELEQLSEVNAKQKGRLVKLEAVKMTKAIQEKFAELQSQNLKLRAQVEAQASVDPPQLVRLSHFAL